MTSTKKQYCERDVIELERQGGFYSLHVEALTSEDLTSKSDIAAELAWRDTEIERLKRERDEARQEFDLLKMRAADHARELANVIEVAIENATYPLEGRIRHLEERERALLPKAERCDRYGTPGPTVLHAEHMENCYVNFWARGRHEPFDARAEEDACDCGRSMRAAAYRVQHARDVEIVERLLSETISTSPPVDPGQREYLRGENERDAKVIRSVLAELTGKGEIASDVRAQPADEQDTSAAEIEAAARLLAAKEEADRQASMRAIEAAVNDWTYVRDLEAPGPALLTQEQIDAVSASDWEDTYFSLVHALLAAQHARDVAIIEAVDDEALGAASAIDDVDASDAAIGRAIKAFILRRFEVA